MEALHFFFGLPLGEQLVLDLLLPPFFVLLMWGSDTLKSYMYNSSFFKDSPKYLLVILGLSYLIVIILTIYCHISR